MGDIWSMVDWITSLFILSVLGLVWYFHFRTSKGRRIWHCVRFHGGGALKTPKPMTIENAIRWLGRDNNVEISHVDHEYGFIFYRPRGGG